MESKWFEGRQYRSFGNYEEAKPHRERWLSHSGSQEKRTPGAWRPEGYSDRGVRAFGAFVSYQCMFRDYEFENGEPFGVPVTAELLEGPEQLRIGESDASEQSQTACP